MHLYTYMFILIFICYVAYVLNPIGSYCALVNMLLAIIMDVYSNVKGAMGDDTEDYPTIWGQTYEIYWSDCVLEPRLYRYAQDNKHIYVFIYSLSSSTYMRILQPIAYYLLRIE